MRPSGFTALLVTSCLAVALAGCGTVTYRPASAASATTSCTKIKDWTSYGTSLRAQTAQLNKVAPTSRAGVTAGAVMAASTVFAYSSRPQTFRTTGVYTFDFGPLASSFHWGSNPKAVAFDAPPDFYGQFNPAPEPIKVVAISGARYLQVAFKISSLRPGRSLASCTDLSLWAY